MTDITRRRFFKLAAGAAAAIAVPISMGDAPVIWADGIHDDGPGLNALVNGEVVQFADPSMAASMGWRGDRLKIAPATYRLDTPIRVAPSFAGRSMEGGHFDVYGDCALNVAVDVEVSFINMGFDVRNMPSFGSVIVIEDFSRA